METTDNKLKKEVVVNSYVFRKMEQQLLDMATTIKSVDRLLTSIDTTDEDTKHVAHSIINLVSDMATYISDEVGTIAWSMEPTRSENI